MVLTEEQKEILSRKLKPLSASKCSICGSRKWIVNDIVFELREFHGGRFVVGGKSAIIPVISVTCGQCGNTLLFNALGLGVIKKENESTKR